MSNTKLPFGLCERYNIKLPDKATPQDAWDALEGETGITPDMVFDGETENAEIESANQKSASVLRETVAQYNKNTFKIPLNFFAEKGLDNQTPAELKKGIRKLELRIEEHKNKIQNPHLCKGWDTMSEAAKAGTVRHWKKELRVFEDNIENRKRKLKEKEVDND